MQIRSRIFIQLIGQLFHEFRRFAVELLGHDDLHFGIEVADGAVFGVDALAFGADAFAAAGAGGDGEVERDPHRGRTVASASRCCLEGF